jgi:HEPN domain-containing protein
MRRETANWVAMSDYDLETAQALFTSGRYLYVVFMCHLALEKILKAYFVASKQKFPPRTHDLIYLVKESNIELPQSYLDFVGMINNVSVPTRYPEDIQRIITQYSQEVAQNYLQKTKEVIAWLKQHLDLKI